MQVSEHVSLFEATKSDTAIKNGIDNNPDPTQLESMKLIATKVFEPVRAFFGKAIGITSFFRSLLLNARIGGASSSQHCKGEAMDLDGDIYGLISNASIFNYIKDNLDFDQLIWEFGTDEEPDWVHVSYRKLGNRKQILKSVHNKKTGKTDYIQYS